MIHPEAPSRERHWAGANWGGWGRRELARGSVSIRDAKFLLGEEAVARRARRLGELELKRVGGAERAWPPSAARPQS